MKNLFKLNRRDSFILLIVTILTFSIQKKFFYQLDLALFILINIVVSSSTSVVCLNYAKSYTKSDWNIFKKDVEYRLYLDSFYINITLFLITLFHTLNVKLTLFHLLKHYPSFSGGWIDSFLIFSLYELLLVLCLVLVSGLILGIACSIRNYLISKAKNISQGK